jgi:diacylglycerol kinase
MKGAHDSDQEAALRKKTLPTFVLAMLIFFLTTAAMTALWMLVVRTMRP